MGLADDRKPVNLMTVHVSKSVTAHEVSNSKPLSFWTDDDINEYIKKYNVKIPDLYSMGYTRNGCMYCGFGVHLEPPEKNRYKRLHETHPLQYDYFITNFGGLMIQFNIAI